MEDEASSSLDGKELNNLRVVDLKQELEKRGLSKSGSKKDLVKRLKQQLEFEKLCKEKKTSGDLVRKIELDAEIQQNEFVQQYLAQQQKRYAEREEKKRLEMEALQNEEKPSEGKEMQMISQDQSVSDSDETCDKKDILQMLPSESEPQKKSQDIVIEDAGKKNANYSSTSESENEESDVPTAVSDRENVIQDFSKTYNEKSDENASQTLPDSTKSCEISQISPASPLHPCSPKMEETPINIDCNSESIESKRVSVIQETQVFKPEDVVEKGPSEIKNADIVTDTPKEVKDHTISSDKDASVVIKEHIELSEPISDISSNSKVEESKPMSPEASVEKAASPQDLTKHQSSENMETSECSSVPYSLSDIQLPESPGGRLKCKDVKSDNKSSVEQSSKPIDNENSPVNKKTQSNGDTTPDSPNTSQEVMSDSPEKTEQRRDSVESRHSDESSDSEAEKESKLRKKAFNSEDTSSNVAADSDENLTRQNVKKEQKPFMPHKRTDESDNEKSTDSDDERRVKNKPLKQTDESDNDKSMDLERYRKIKKQLKPSKLREQTGESDNEKSTDSERSGKVKREEKGKHIDESDNEKSTDSGKYKKAKREQKGKHTDESDNEKSTDSGKYKKVKREQKGKHTDESDNEKSTDSGKYKKVKREQKGKQTDESDIEKSTDSSKYRKIKRKQKGKQSDESDTAQSTDSSKYSQLKKEQKQSKQNDESDKEKSTDSEKGSIKVEKEQKGKQSDESDNEKSTDSEKHKHPEVDKKYQSKHSKDEHFEKRRRDSSTDSSSSSDSSSTTSESNTERSPGKITLLINTKNLRKYDENNHISRKSSDEEAEQVKKENGAKESSNKSVSNASPAKRLKIKRDNVPIEKTSTQDIPQESSEIASSSKSVEKNISTSLSENDNSKPESSVVKKPTTEVTYTPRKVTLSNRKLNRNTSEDKSSEPKTKKKKWDNFASAQKTSRNSISISTDSLKNWFPDFKLMSEASSSMEIETDEHEHSFSAVEEKNVDYSDVSNVHDNAVKLVKQDSVSQMDIEDSKSQEPNYEEIEEKGPVSRIIFIQNLVRPFTLNQLKDLLKQSGNIVEEYFWIDKIKSKCFVMYETEKEAIKAKHTLNNTRWPSSNPKILSVEFSNEEELELHKKGNEPPPPPPPPKAVIDPPVIEPLEVVETRVHHTVEEHKRREREKRRDRDRSKPQAPVREWDKDKVIQDSPEREHAMREEKHPQSRSSDKKEKKESKKRPNEDTPAKLLDDLFQKTKSPPCIYWLPLTEEQAKQKEEAKKQRKLEREKRNQQLRDQEAERRNRRDRSSRRSREKENRKSSTRSRSPVTRRR